MPIIDTITTIASVCLLQGHNMNIRTTSDAKRKYSDDEITTIINNVINFVYGNSYEDLNTNLQLFCINTLSVIALNNLMHSREELKNWEYQDPYDKDRFYEMVRTFKEDSKDIDVISTYRGQFHDIEGSV